MGRAGPVPARRGAARGARGGRGRATGPTSRSRAPVTCCCCRRGPPPAACSTSCARAWRRGVEARGLRRAGRWRVAAPAAPARPEPGRRRRSLLDAALGERTCRRDRRRRGRGPCAPDGVAEPPLPPADEFAGAPLFAAAAAPARAIGSAALRALRTLDEEAVWWRAAASLAEAGLPAPEPESTCSSVLPGPAGVPIEAVMRWPWRGATRGGASRARGRSDGVGRDGGLDAVGARPAAARRRPRRGCARRSQARPATGLTSPTSRLRADAASAPSRRPAPGLAAARPAGALPRRAAPRATRASTRRWRWRWRSESTRC
jgi:hypothetical protein